MTAAPNSTTFFQKVCQLVSTSASPKQPQSLMGFSMASHSVSSVITTIMASVSLVTTRRRMAKSRQMPSTNSMADCRMEAESVTKSGTSSPKCIATR